jgi:type I restriction enzyme S subunit
MTPSEEATLDKFIDGNTELLHSEPEGVRLVLDESYPKEWRFAELENICEVKSGFTWNKEQETDSAEDGAVPVIKIGNVQNGYLDLTDTLYLQGVSDEDLQKNKVRKNWLLMIGSNGSGERVGHCGIIEKNMEFVYASFLYGLNADSEHILPRYLFYLLNRPKVQQRLTSFTAGSTSLKNLNKSTIENLSLPTPPLHEQRKIATVLYTVDQAIEKSEGIIEQYRRIYSGLLQSEFHEHQEIDTKEAGALGKVPISWRVVPLSQVAKVTMGNSPKSEYYNSDGNGLPFYQGADEFGERSPTPDRWCSNPKKVGKPGDTLLNIRSHTNVGKVNQAHHECCIGRGLAAITPGEKIDGDYLYHHLRERENYINSIASGSTFDSVNTDEVESVKIVLPPIDTQQKIASALTNIQNGILKQKKMMAKYDRLKHGLMQNLHSGTVRTTDADVDILKEVTQHG